MRNIHNEGLDKVNANEERQNVTARPLFSAEQNKNNRARHVYINAFKYNTARTLNNSELPTKCTYIFLKNLRMTGEYFLQEY
jgi:hypothetical protein